MSKNQTPENLERLLDKLPDSTSIRNELIATRKSQALLRRLLKIRLEAEKCGQTPLADSARQLLAAR